jgi:PIN domain nuclease of toxin-antitoxin system
MRVLLDSHAFFWWMVDHPKLSGKARGAIADAENEIYVSAVVPWEIATKVRLGRWDEAKPVIASFDDAILRYGFIPLSITIAHARTAGSLTAAHGDPFDRVLASQAQLENMPLVTADPAFRLFGTQIIW